MSVRRGSVGGTTKTASLEDGDGEFVIVGGIPPRSDVVDGAEIAASFYPDIELADAELDRTPRLFRTVVEDELIDRRWTALTAAYYAGCFEQPARARTGYRRAPGHQTTDASLPPAGRPRVVFRTLLEGIGEGTGTGAHDPGAAHSDE